MNKQKNTGGNTMSLTKSATRRLSLLAGSSLVAASLATAVSVGAMFAPATAFAADECTPAAGTSTNGPGAVSDDPALNGATADTFNCNATTYSSGVTYNSFGDLTVNMPGTSGRNVGAAGVDLTGDDLDDVTFNAEGRVTGTSGAVVDVRSDEGDINVTVAGITGTGSSATTTHGVRAISDEGGDVSVLVTGNIFANVNNINSQNAIEAISAGGNGNVSVTVDYDAIQNTNARQRAIYAVASGTGTLTINNHKGLGVTTSASLGGIASIEAITGTGLMTINILEGGSATGGAGILARPGGDAVITNDGGLRLDVKVNTARTVSLTGTGSITGIVAADGTGAGNLDVQTSGRLTGVIDLTAFTGAFGLDLTGAATWEPPSVSLFGPGATTMSIGPEVVVPTSEVVFTPPPGGVVTTWDFGAGVDSLDFAGLLVVGEGSGSSLGSAPATVRMDGLETFTHSGRIILGAVMQGDNVLRFGADTADGDFDDVLKMTSGVFTGADGVVVMDADVVGSQTSCDRDAEDELAAADCLDLRGASTAGRTFLLINDSSNTLRGGSNLDGVVVVDVAGAGTSAQGHFVISPDTLRYSPQFGGVIDKGDFLHTIVYDEATQQHKLVGVPGGVLQFAPLVGSVQTIWRTSAGNIFARQSQLRADGMDGLGMGGNVWFRGSADFAERDLFQSVSAYDQTFIFDHSFEQDTLAFNAGADLVALDTEDGSLAVGVTLGYAKADIEYADSPNQVQFRGFNAGAYASYVAGGFYLDASVSGLGLTLDDDIPALALAPDGTIITTNANVVGAQAEAGWRIPLADVAFIEPLASIAFTRTRFDDLRIGVSGDPVLEGTRVMFDDADSLRAGVGARLGVESAYGPIRVQGALTGRVWNEFDGESSLVVFNTGADTPLGDEFTGTFSDIAATIVLADPTGAFSGFVEAGGKFGDDFQSTSVSAGLRYSW